MGKCAECGRDMGYFNGDGWSNSTCSTVCADKNKAKKIIYGSRVRVKRGFYEGQEGVVCGEYRDIGVDDELAFARAYGWPVKLTSGEIKYINQFHIERVLDN